MYIFQVVTGTPSEESTIGDKKGVLRAGSNVFICLTHNDSESPYIDPLSPRRISTIIAAEFVKHADRVEIGLADRDSNSVFGEIPEFEFNYIIKPLLLGWSSSLNSSDNSRNHIKLKVEIYTAEPVRELVSFTIDEIMTWHSTGIDHPCELIIEPLERIAADLFA
jgi:hypothetical protein